MDRFELVMMEEIEVKMNNLSIISMAYTFADFFEMHIKRPGHASFEQVNSYNRTFYFIKKLITEKVDKEYLALHTEVQNYYKRESI